MTKRMVDHAGRWIRGIGAPDEDAADTKRNGKISIDRDIKQLDQRPCQTIGNGVLEKQCWAASPGRLSKVLLQCIGRRWQAGYGDCPSETQR